VSGTLHPNGAYCVSPRLRQSAVARSARETVPCPRAAVVRSVRVACGFYLVDPAEPGEADIAAAANPHRSVQQQQHRYIGRNPSGNVCGCNIGWIEASIRYRGMLVPNTAWRLLPSVALPSMHRIRTETRCCVRQRASWACDQHGDRQEAGAPCQVLLTEHEDIGLLP